MAAFEYQAVDAEGHRHRGFAEGDAGRQIRQQLRASGLTVLTIKAVPTPTAGLSFKRWFGPRVNTEQLALLTRLLATLLRAGLPIDDVLLALAEQHDGKHVRRVLYGVRARVLEGHSLAASLGLFPETFPDVYRATVAAGEQTRHLPLVLERLADYSEERHRLQQHVQAALLYPAILTVTAICIVAGLLVYVVPEVTRVFASLDRELPALTVVLIALSDWVRAYGTLSFIALVILGIFIRIALRRPHLRRRYHRLLLSLPLVGRLVRENDAARLTRTLGILLASGVPMIEALSIASQSLNNLIMRAAAEQAVHRVQEGEPLHRALRETGQLPPLTIHLIASGEASGRLDTLLDTAARAHEQSLQSVLGTLLTLLEPALILTMGLVVLAIVLAILLPIFELNELV